MAFQLKLKYLHVKITKPLWAVVYMSVIFGINTTRDISKLSQIFFFTYKNFETSLVVFGQISLQIMLLPILIRF